VLDRDKSVCSSADIHQAFLTLACILICCDFAVRLL
jgi:hypothetical protein